MMVASHLDEAQLRDNYTLTQHVMYAFKSQDMSDVEVQIFDAETDEQRMKLGLHKVMLGRCTYFKNMLCGSFKESTMPSISLYYYEKGWIEEIVLNLFFSMFYTANFDDIRDQILPYCLPLHCLSKKTGFEVAINYLEAMIMQSINKTTLYDIFGYCAKYDMSSPLIKKSCLQWIKAWFWTLNMGCMIQFLDVSTIKYILNSKDIISFGGGKLGLLETYLQQRPESEKELSRLHENLKREERESNSDYNSHRSTFYLRHDGAGLDSITYETPRSRSNSGENTPESGNSLLSMQLPFNLSIDSQTPTAAMDTEQTRKRSPNQTVTRIIMDIFEMGGCVWEIHLMYNHTINKAWISLSSSTKTKGGNSPVIYRTENQSFNIEITVYAIHKTATFTTTHNAVISPNLLRLDLKNSIVDTVINDPFVFSEESEIDSTDKEIKMHAFIVDIKILNITSSVNTQLISSTIVPCL